MYEIGDAEIEAVAEVIRSKKLFRYRGGEGGQCDTCEAKLRELFGCSEATIVTSGTGALICGLVGLGIGPGDEVIVPAYTWLASAGAVLSVGAIPVLADVDRSLTLDPDDLARRIGPRTKAVIPVHMGGRPCDMDRIMAVAREHGIAVLEDACQAVGGSYKGRRLGSIGDAGALSFNMFKIISCGEGGALLTSNRQVFERGLYHSDMGCSFRQHQLTEEPFLGNSYRMNEIQAAVLRVQLDRLDGILAKLRQRRDWVLETIEDEDAPLDFSPPGDPEGDCGIHTAFLFADDEEAGAVAERAKELGCDTYRPINSGLHVYTNWDVLLKQHGAAHPAMNPFHRPENEPCRRDLQPDSCTRTLQLLRETLIIGGGYATSRDECTAMAKAFCQAARDIRG